MSFIQLLKRLLPTLLVLALIIAAYFTRSTWLPWVTTTKAGDAASSQHEAASVTDKVLLSDQAIANLGIKSLPLVTSTYWKSITVPGMIVDRPGQSDRGVVSPVMGVIETVHRFPGESVAPGEPLFTIRVLSETLHQAQSELFKTAQNIKLTQTQKARLLQAGNAIPESRLLEIDQQLSRMEIGARAARAELGTRGFTPEQIEGIAEGKFVKEIEIVVPPLGTTANLSPGAQKWYEVQELKAELGQQVQAGQTLCTLANHRILAIEGRAFRDETPFLERAVKEDWPVEVDFQEPEGTGWSPNKQAFHIQHLANTIDPVNRTFAFRIPLENESKGIQQGTTSQTFWRYRPGQKVRIQVPIEKWENVFVLPKDAIARDGLESILFTQNVNTFLRRPVKVLLQDRQTVVIANDGTFPAGLFVAQSGAAQLQRMMKSQTSGAPPGYHMHADGSIHKNGEDEK
ncbi:MAG TPA: efflux RND transporter periplasmic adaptor subunit [Gemmatales bacterium]|nr:efflux RND transporter periplasmic adaptor subunit [Gemmatales bacterium]